MKRRSSISLDADEAELLGRNVARADPCDLMDADPAEHFGRVVSVWARKRLRAHALNLGEGLAVADSGGESVPAPVRWTD